MPRFTDTGALAKDATAAFESGQRQAELQARIGMQLAQMHQRAGMFEQQLEQRAEFQRVDERHRSEQLSMTRGHYNAMEANQKYIRERDTHTKGMVEVPSEQQRAEKQKAEETLLAYTQGISEGEVDEFEPEVWLAMENAHSVLNQPDRMEFRPRPTGDLLPPTVESGQPSTAAEWFQAGGKWAARVAHIPEADRPFIDMIQSWRNNQWVIDPGSKRLDTHNAKIAAQNQHTLKMKDAENKRRDDQRKMFTDRSAAIAETAEAFRTRDPDISVSESFKHAEALHPQFSGYSPQDVRQTQITSRHLDAAIPTLESLISKIDREAGRKHFVEARPLIVQKHSLEDHLEAARALKAIIEEEQTTDTSLWSDENRVKFGEKLPYLENILGAKEPHEAMDATTPERTGISESYYDIVEPEAEKAARYRGDVSPRKQPVPRYELIAPLRQNPPFGLRQIDSPENIRRAIEWLKNQATW